MHAASFLQYLIPYNRAGYKALAVTVDTPVLGRREADIR